MTIEVPLLSPTSRFSDRAENYMKHRPGYPQQIIPFLENTLGLQKSARIADIGSGTGLFAEPLLKNGYQVICIEPNEAMRKAGEEKLKQYPLFISRRRSGETTGLRNQSIDLITVAQAFHWMDVEAAKKEFKRILKTGSYVLLVWNLQKTDTDFLNNYAEIKHRYQIEERDSHEMDAEKVSRFFGTNQFQKITFPNTQELNFDALKGRLLSSSYIPLPGHPSYENMISDLVQLFVRCNKKGFVTMEYETVLYYGLLH